MQGSDKQNLTAGLAVPAGVRIDFGFFPRLPRARAARHMAMQEAADEVRRALLAWQYESVQSPGEK